MDEISYGQGSAWAGTAVSLLALSLRTRRKKIWWMGRGRLDLWRAQSSHSLALLGHSVLSGSIIGLILAKMREVAASHTLQSQLIGYPSDDSLSFITVLGLCVCTCNKG